MPLPPCKVFLFGPEEIGKTTLANLIAEYFKAKVTICGALVLICRILVGPGSHNFTWGTGVGVGKASLGLSQAVLGR